MTDDSRGKAAAAFEDALFVGAVAGFSATLAESALLCARAEAPRAELRHLAEAILLAGGVHGSIGLLAAMVVAGLSAAFDLRARSASKAPSGGVSARERLVGRLTALSLVVCFSAALSALVNRAALVPSPLQRLTMVGVSVVLTMTLAVAIASSIRRIITLVIAFFEPRRAAVALLGVAAMAASAVAVIRSPHSQFAYLVLLTVFGATGAVLAMVKRGGFSRVVVRSMLAVSLCWLASAAIVGQTANAYLMHRMGRTLVAVILRELPFRRSTPVEERVGRALLARFRSLPLTDEAGIARARTSEASPVAPMDRPDIVLLTIDTLRADRLLGTPSRMPSLMAIAKEGALFENAFASAPATIGAMTQVLTGQQEHDVAHLIGSPSAKARLDPATPTIASRLRALGYETVAVAGGRLVSYYSSFGLGFSSVVDVKEGMKPLSAAEIVDAFERIASRPDRRAPLFGWLHFLEPHNHTDLRAPVPQGYDAIVGEIDAEIGRLHAFLKASPRFDRTVLLVLADHGEGLGERGFYYHGVSLPTVIQIPFVARFPGEPPTVVDELVSQLDVAPTLLAAAGERAPSLPGRALQRAFSAERPPRRLAFFENIYYIEPVYPHEIGVVAPPWFFSFDARDQRSVLIDLAADPSGLVNLADERPEEVERLGGLVVDELERAPLDRGE